VWPGSHLYILAQDTESHKRTACAISSRISPCNFRSRRFSSVHVGGGGKRLFADGTIPMAFQLTDSEATSSGVIVANDERAGDAETALMGT
jgi:hypothetical protein